MQPSEGTERELGIISFTHFTQQPFEISKILVASEVISQMVAKKRK